MKKSIIVKLLFLLSFSTTSYATQDQKLIEDAIAFVKLGYGDNSKNTSFRSVNFTTDCYETRVIQPAIKQVVKYNDFDGEKVSEALKAFEGLISCYAFGRQSSPVLHVHFPYWTHQRENPGKSRERISEQQTLELVEKMKFVFMNQLNADSFEQDSIMERKYIVWWD